MNKLAINGTGPLTFEFNQVEPIVKKWMLTIILFLGGDKEFILKEDFRRDNVAKVLELDSWIDVKPEEFDKLAIKMALKRLYVTVQLADSHSLQNTDLTTNLNKLADLVGLDKTEKKLILFAVMINTCKELDDVCDFLGDLNSNSVCQVLSILLDEPFTTIKRAFNQQSKLSQSGLLALDRDGQGYLSNKLDLFSRQFADIISSDVTAPINLIREMVFKSQAAHLNLENYPYLKQEISILQPYFKHVKNSKRKGVNIFIYGSPGTGKTQFVRALAQECGFGLYEVSSEDADGDIINGWNRLRALSAGQRFLSQQSSMILFDETEDIFNDGGFFAQSTASKNKAWLNNFLEENEIPTFWLSNSISGLDPAVIRRFDLIFEIPIPPKTERKNIINKICGEQLDECLLSELASSENLAPAVIAKTSSIIDCIKDDIKPSEVNNSFSYIINKTLYAQGHAKLTQFSNELPSVYDPNFIQTDCDLIEITQGLELHKSGRLCLFGPPGTGKTAYGYWLSQQLGKNIVVKKASDLLSAYVGESEKNIARAFEQAKDEEGILMLDEVDTFLQDRRFAKQSWEITQVNEMLTQMESFNGVFIASTNLIDNLDQASLRRFDLKVKFDYLNLSQRENLLANYCRLFNIEYDKSVVSLANLTNLTPGDFNVIARQHKFRKFTKIESVISALNIESKMKGDSSANPIGFR